MHPDPIIRRLHACAIAHVPVCLIGAPGTGKTARVAQYAASLNAQYERWLLSRCEPIDLKPRAVNAKGEINVSDPPEIQRLKASQKGVLFLDELNRCERNTEGAALDLLDSAPEHVIVIAAINPPAPGQAARPLESAAGNRFCHIPVGVDAEAWALGMLTGWTTSGVSLPWPSKQDLEPHIAQAKARIAPYVRTRGNDTLEKPPTDPVKAGGAWPSTRTWEYAIHVYGVALALNLDADDVEALLSGLLGSSVGSELFSYLVDPQNALPDIEALLKDPSSWPIPVGRADMAIAVSSALAQAVSRKLTDQRYVAAWSFCRRLVEQNELGAAAVFNQLFRSHIDQATKDGVKLTAITKLMPQRLAVMVNAVRANTGST